MITIIGDHTHSHGHSHGKPPAAPAADKKKEKSSDNEEEDDDKSTSEAKEQKTEAAPVSDAKGMCSNCKLVLLSLFLKPDIHMHMIRFAVILTGCLYGTMNLHTHFRA